MSGSTDMSVFLCLRASTSTAVADDHGHPDLHPSHFTPLDLLFRSLEAVDPVILVHCLPQSKVRRSALIGAVQYIGWEEVHRHRAEAAGCLFAPFFSPLG